MKTFSVPEAKDRLYAVPAQVEAGEEVVITRRGVAIVLFVAEPAAKLKQFDLNELLAFVDGQPMHIGADAGQFVGDMRADARL